MLLTEHMLINYKLLVENMMSGYLQKEAVSSNLTNGRLAMIIVINNVKKQMKVLMPTFLYSNGHRIYKGRSQD